MYDRSMKIYDRILNSNMHGKSNAHQLHFSTLWMVNAYQLYDPCSNSADCTSQTPDPQKNNLWLWARVIWLEPSSTVIKNLLQRSSRDYGSDWSPTNWLASCCCHVHIGDANTKTIAKCSCSSDTAAMCATNGAEKVIETIDTESIAGMQSSPETSEPFFEEEEELKWNPTTLTSHVIDWINRVRSSRKNEKNFWNQFENTYTQYTC